MPNGVRYTNVVRALHRRFCQHCGGLSSRVPKASAAKKPSARCSIADLTKSNLSLLEQNAGLRAEIERLQSAAVPCRPRCPPGRPRATVPEETAADIRRRHGLGVLPSRISRDLGLTSYQIKNVLKGSSAAAGPSAEEPTKQ